MADRRAVEFNKELIDLIRKYYPTAIRGNIEENALCARHMAIALGGMVAQAYRLNGAVAGRSTLQAIVGAIISNIEEVDAKASELAKKDLKIIN